MIEFFLVTFFVTIELGIILDPSLTFMFSNMLLLKPKYELFSTVAPDETNEPLPIKQLSLTFENGAKDTFGESVQKLLTFEFE